MVSSELYTERLHKGTDEKQRIREWQRKNEIHPLAYYDAFNLNDIFYENNSHNDSDFDGTISSDPLSHTMAINETQMSGLILELPNLEDDSLRKPVTTRRECTCNINSEDIRNNITPNRVPLCQRKKVSSPAA